MGNPLYTFGPIKIQYHYNIIIFWPNEWHRHLEDYVYHNMKPNLQPKKQRLAKYKIKSNYFVVFIGPNLRGLPIYVE